jgi:hypothetical protein
MDFRAEAEKIEKQLPLENDVTGEGVRIAVIESFGRRFWDEAINQSAQKCNEQLGFLEEHESETGGMEEVLACFNGILSLKSGAPTEDKRPLKKDPSLGPGQEWHG